jgi:hypothetical protein
MLRLQQSGSAHLNSFTHKMWYVATLQQEALTIQGWSQASRHDGLTFKSTTELAKSKHAVGMHCARIHTTREEPKTNPDL